MVVVGERGPVELVIAPNAQRAFFVQVWADKFLGFGFARQGGRFRPVAQIEDQVKSQARRDRRILVVEIGRRGRKFQ